ncbi:hypothetical protein SAMN05421505_11184 [Sinosporangium album]|uniref:Uncharacterized protein n=1 Tax=Sinosporangium album TaxID=504805 RepID=A0A1G7ZLI3_9ACTN|nr:hypothetical protein [Sinosporangium album]SDH08960.1 hypothetical protein SAMN05421505_11184 [Sinosporangium album]
MTAAVQTALRVPHVIAYSEEAVPQHLAFRRSAMQEPYLSYPNPRGTDWALGVLRARVRGNRRGQPQWRFMNTARQWRCMVKGLCQVCGQPAIDPDGRLPWIITETAYRQLGDGHHTSAPATCRHCIPESLASCPQLRKSGEVYTAASAEPSAVLADMFAPGPGGRAVHTGEHNVFVSLEWTDLVRSALATQLIVRLHDLRPA